MADSLEEWKLNFRKSHEDDDSDLSDADTSQGMPVIPIQEPPEATNPTSTLILVFWLLEL